VRYCSVVVRLVLLGRPRPSLQPHLADVVVVDLPVAVADPNPYPPLAFADACFSALKGKNEKKPSQLERCKRKKEIKKDINGACDQ
jgi:hypothetical protein